MKCVNCGQELPDSAAFCSNCGTLVQKAEQTGADEGQLSSAYRSDPVQKAEQTGVNEETKTASEPSGKKEWKDLYTIGAIAGLCVLAGVVGFVVKSVKNAPEQVPPEVIEAQTETEESDSYEEVEETEEESDSEFLQIKEDYEKNRLDYAEAKNALAQLDTSELSEEEADEVLEFADMLEEDLKKDFSELASESDYETLLDHISQLEKETDGEDKFLAEMRKKYEEEYAEKTAKKEADSYVIPDSNSRYLTDADISGLDIQQVNYAKNEIYARHGRKFQSNELQTYFNGKSWYNGTIEPAAFNEGVLNDYERKNAEKLSRREFSMESGGYKLDQ